MDIRKDFESAAPYLHRLWGIGNEFARLNNEDWPHMKNREDFRFVYTMEHPRQAVLENVYGDGRDMAGYMSDHLREFNSVLDYPTMTSYVESFAKNWCARVDEYKNRILEMKVHAEPTDTPWAVKRMISMWETQVRLLEAVNATVELLKQTDIYRIEKGEIKVSDLNKQNLNVGVIGNVHGGKVNVGSTDNSTSINITTNEVFNGIREALNRSHMPESEKETLTQCLASMEADVGKPGFVKRYQDFVAAGANHMTVLSPFLPALTGLLGSSRGLSSGLRGLLYCSVNHQPNPRDGARQTCRGAMRAAIRVQPMQYLREARAPGLLRRAHAIPRDVRVNS